MKKNNDKLKAVEGVFSKIIASVGIVMFSFLAISNFLYTTYLHDGLFETYADDKGNNLIGAVFLLLTLFIIWKVSEYIPFKVLVPIGFALISVFVFFGIEYALKSGTSIVGDQEICYVSAKYLYEGDRDWVLYSMGYFKANPHQLYLSEFYAMLFKLFRNTEIKTIQIVQCVLAGTSMFFVPLCTKKLWQNKNETTLSFMLLYCFITYWLFSLFVYGDIWGVSLCIIGIYLFFAGRDLYENKKVAAYLVGMGTSVLLAFAFNFRMLLCVVLIAVFMIGVTEALSRKKWYGLIVAVAALIMTVGIKFAYTSYAQSFADEEIGKGMPISLFIAMGLNDGEYSVGNGAGSYNGSNMVIFHECNDDPKASDVVAKEYISEKIGYYMGNPKQFCDFMFRKLVQQWNIPDRGAFAHTSYYNQQGNAKWIDSMYNWYYSLKGFYWLGLHQVVCNFLTVAYYIEFWFNKKQDDNSLKRLLPGLILVGGVGASMIWEAMARYTFPYVLFECICASRGLSFICQKLSEPTDKIKKKLLKKN